MAKNKIAYQERFDLAGHDVFVQILELDGYTNELIETKVESAETGGQPDYTVPRLALLQNCIHKLVVDGTDIDLRPKQRSAVPRIWDKASGDTLTTRLFKIIINNVEPELAEQFEDCFGKYLDDVVEPESFPTTTKPSGTSQTREQVAEKA